MEREPIFYRVQRETTAFFTPLIMDVAVTGVKDIQAQGKKVYEEEKITLKNADSHIVHLLNICLLPTHYPIESYHSGGIYAHYLLRQQAETNGKKLPAVSRALASALKRDYQEEEKEAAITDGRDIFQDEYGELRNENLPLHTGIAMLSSVKAYRQQQQQPRLSVQDYMLGFKAGAAVVNRALSKAAMSSYFSSRFDWENKA